MIILIHVLEHFGVPSGAAIAVVIGVMKVVKGGAAKLGAHRDPDGHRTFPAGQTPDGHHEDRRDKR
jgi:hypothetical protein